MKSVIFDREHNKSDRSPNTTRGLNKEKTEVIAFGNKDEVLKVNAYLDSRVKQQKIKSESWGDSGDRP